MPKTIAIAGGTGGLGAAICRELATRGHYILVGYHSRKDAAEQLATELGPQNIHINGQITGIDGGYSA